MSDVYKTQKEIYKLLNGTPSIPFTHKKHNIMFNPAIVVSPIRDTGDNIRFLGRRETWWIDVAPGNILFVDRHDVPIHILIGTDEVGERQKKFTVRLFNPTQEGLREKLVANLNDAQLGHYVEGIQLLYKTSLMITIDNVENWGDVTVMMGAFIETAKQAAR